MSLNIRIFEPTACVRCIANKKLDRDCRKYLASFRNAVLTFDNAYKGEYCNMIIRAKIMEDAEKIARRLMKPLGYTAFNFVAPFPEELMFNSKN